MLRFMSYYFRKKSDHHSLTVCFLVSDLKVWALLPGCAGNAHITAATHTLTSHTHGTHTPCRNLTPPNPTRSAPVARLSVVVVVIVVVVIGGLKSSLVEKKA